VRLSGVLPPFGDALVAAVFVAATVAESVFSETTRPPLIHAAIAVPAMTLLAWRRRIPLAVAAAIIAANAAITSSEQFSTLLALVLVSFTCGAELDPPSSWIGLAIVTVPFFVALTLEGLEPSDLAAGMVFLFGDDGLLLGVRLRAVAPTRGTG